jgi:hypothetical protein
MRMPPGQDAVGLASAARDRAGLKRRPSRNPAYGRAFSAWPGADIRWGRRLPVQALIASAINPDLGGWRYVDGFGPARRWVPPITAIITGPIRPARPRDSAYEHDATEQQRGGGAHVEIAPGAAAVVRRRAAAPLDRRELKDQHTGSSPAPSVTTCPTSSGCARPSSPCSWSARRDRALGVHRGGGDLEVVEAFEARALATAARI